MPAGELRTVARRPGALELLRRHADSRLCGIAVVDGEGAVLASDDVTSGLAVAVADGALRVQGVDLAATSEVRAFDRVVGWVVSAPRAGTNLNGTPADVARRSADLLSDLCAREYELNDLSREILGAYEELNLFYDLSAELAAARDASAIAGVIARKAATILGAAGAWVLLADPASGALRAAHAVGAPAGRSDLAPGEGLAGRCFASRAPEAVDDPATLPPSALAGWERVRGGPVLTAPLSAGEREDRAPQGVLQVVRARGAAPFTSGELKLACALASHAAVLLENQRLIAIEREMAIARTVQQSLLPAAAPDLPGLDVAGRSVAAQSVGGDYYDHFEADDGTLALAVADVSGHDVAAALVQASLRATVRAHLRAAPAAGPGAVLDGVNRALFEDLSRAEMFLTAWVASVDGTTGRVAYSDAGHPEALVLRAETGAVETIGAGGPPVGVLPDGDFAFGETRLAPGDVLVAFTDGLVEARSASDGAEYGTDRLARALRAAAGLPAAAIADALLADVASFDGGGPAPDDRSVVVVKMRNPDSR